MKSVLRLSSFVLLLFTVHCSLSTALGQFLGYTAGQTVTKNLTINAGAPTVKTTTTLPNYGQVGHSLQVTYGQAVAHCTTWLQASNTGGINDWFTLIQVPNIAGNNTTQIGYGNGYFPFLRIIGNANNAVGCTVSINWSYTGYQSPIPAQATIYNSPHTDIAASVTLTPSIEYPAGEILAGFTCHNPNGSTAYLEIMDKNPPPAGLGSFILYQIGIPAGQTFVYPGPAIYSGNALAAGAATAASGVVAVGVPLVCDFALNLNGPFGPFLGMPNRL